MRSLCNRLGQIAIRLGTFLRKQRRARGIHAKLLRAPLARSHALARNRFRRSRFARNLSTERGVTFLTILAE